MKKNKQKGTSDKKLELIPEVLLLLNSTPKRDLVYPETIYLTVLL